MVDLNKAVDDTSGYEGYKSAPYLDEQARWTVGEGTCLETNPISGTDWKYLLDNHLITVTLNGTGARWLLRSCLAQRLSQLAARFPGWSTMPDLAQTLLLEISYQLGVQGLLNLTDFCKLVQSGQWAAAASDGRKTLWYKQTTARAEKILTQLEGI